MVLWPFRETKAGIVSCSLCIYIYVNIFPFFHSVSLVLYCKLFFDNFVGYVDGKVSELEEEGASSREGFYDK